MGRKSSQKKQKKEKKAKKEHVAIGKRGLLSLQADSEGSGNKYGTRKWYWILAVVLALSVLSYANSLQNEFVFDDILVIVENPGIRGVEKLPRLLGINARKLSYRPIRMISYALDYTLNEKLWYYFGNYQGSEKGLNPLGFHISNIAFHIITSFLVFLVVFRLAGSCRVAFLASAIFALHPVHTDSVTYLSGRRDILCALFYLLGFYCFLRYRQNNKLFFIIAAFVFYVFSLGSKEMGVTLPMLFFTYDVMQQYSVKRGALDRAFFKELFTSAKKTVTQSPYLYTILFLGATAFSYYKIVIKSPSYQTTFYGDSLYVTFLTVGRILAHYMHLLLYPVNLNADYSKCHEFITA